MAVTFDYDGKKVLVTGGSQGMGNTVARAFRDAGAEVTITGRRGAASEYDGDLSGMGYLSCELARREDLESVAAQLGDLDVLVNNAGQNMVMDDEWDPDIFERVVQVNLSGTFRLTSLCHDRLAQSRGAVVNVASLTSFVAVDFVPGYGSAKAGVVQMTRALATKWGPEGIRVNAIAPGVTETNMTTFMLKMDEMVQANNARTPLGRIGYPDDIAPVVLFLADDAAGFITGQTLVIDGGYLCQG